MKRKNLLFIAAAALGMFVSSCAKVTPGKIDGTWNVTSGSGSTESIIYAGTTQYINTSSFTFDGTYMTNTFDGVTDPPTEYTQFTYSFTKDNTWSKTTTLINNQPSVNWSETITRTQSGSWTILGADKARDIKSGDRLNLTLSNETLVVTTTINGVTTSYTTNENISSDQGSEVWMVTELTKNSLTATIDESSSSYQDGQLNEKSQRTSTYTLTKQ